MTLNFSPCLLALATIFCFSCNNSNRQGTSSNAQPDTAKKSSSAAPQNIDTLMQTTLYDSMNISVPSFASFGDVKNLEKIEAIEKKITTPLQITFYTEPNFQGQGESFNPGTYSREQLSKFLQTGIMSMKVPVGLSTDLSFLQAFAKSAPDGEKFPHNMPHGGHDLVGGGFIDRSTSTTDEVEWRNVGQHFLPGDYTSLPTGLKNPTGSTIYNFTDCYFSDDDPGIPSAIESIGLEYTSNGSGYSSISPKISLNKGFYGKGFRFAIPEGKEPVLWESTGNGDHKWFHRITPSGDSLYIGLYIKTRPIAGARNWEGVCFSLIDKN